MITVVRLALARPDHSQPQPAEWSAQEDDQLARAVDAAARRVDAAQLDAGREASAVAALTGGSAWAPRDWEAVAAAMSSGGGGEGGGRRTLVECCNRWTRLCYERILAPAAAAAAAASNTAVPSLPSPSAERRTAEARALALHALQSSPIAASALFQRPTSSASPPLASSASSLLYAAVAPASVAAAAAAGDATGAAPPAALLLSVPGPGVSLDSADSLELPPLELITSTGSLSHSRSQLLAPLSTRSHAHTQQQQQQQLPSPRPLPPPVQAPSAQLQLEESVELPSLEAVLAASAAQLPLTQTGDESPSGDNAGPLPLPPLHRGESGRSLASASLPYDSEDSDGEFDGLGSGGSSQSALADLLTSQLLREAAQADSSSVITPLIKTGHTYAWTGSSTRQTTAHSFLLPRPCAGGQLAFELRWPC